MAIILFLGLVLRLVNLNQSFWLDEAVQVITSQGSFLNIFSELSGDFHPPLYHFLMWGWGRVFGYLEISMRMPSVLFGVATIWVVYKIAGLLASSPRGCKTAALLMATAPFHIYYSQEARPYAMVAFLTSLSMYFFMKILINPPPGCKLPVFGYVVSTILMLYAGYYGFLIILAQAIIILLRRKYILLACCSIALLFFIPWLPMFLTQVKTGRQAMVVLPEWGRLVNISFLKALPLTFIKFSIGRITIFNKKIYAVVAGGLFLLYGKVIGRVIKRKKELLTIVLWFFIPTLFAWLASLFIPNYQPFRLLLVLPAFYLLLALGISRTESSMIRIIELSLVTAVSLVSLGVYYFNPYFHREDWRGLVNYIESQPQQQQEVVALLPSETSNWPWRYYSGGSVDLLAVSSGVKQVSNDDFSYLTIQLFSYSEVYYVCYLVPLFDPQEKIDFWLKEQGFAKIKEISFNQVLVERWELGK